MTCQNLTYNNGKYTKIFEEINNEEWSNYCTIISNDNNDNPEVYLCNNELQGFIHLKNLIYEVYHNHGDDDKFNNDMLREFSAMDNLNDLYEAFCARNRSIKIDLVYCELNEEVELDKWIVDWEFKNTTNKFNL